MLSKAVCCLLLIMASISLQCYLVGQSIACAGGDGLQIWLKRRALSAVLDSVESCYAWSPLQLC
jgi:hypothetical protein